MTGLFTVLVLAVPAALVVWLLLGGPFERDVDLRRRMQRSPGKRLYQMARVGRPGAVPLSAAGGAPAGLTIEPVGLVVPEVVEDPAAMVPAAAHAFVESNAMAAAEETPAYQAAAASPAALAAASTPLAEEAPVRFEDDD